MAQSKTGVVAPTKEKMTAAEMQQWIQDHDRALKNYAAALDPLKRLRDVTKPARKKVDSLTKDMIVEYLKNPVQNEKKIINCSWYMYYRNIVYSRLITYFSTLLEMDARELIPRYNYITPQSDDQILKSWYDTASMLSNWNTLLFHCCD